MIYTLGEALQSCGEFNQLEDKKKPLQEHGRKGISEVVVGCDSIAMTYACNAVQPTDRIDFNYIICKVSLRYESLLNTTG